MNLNVELLCTTFVHQYQQHTHIELMRLEMNGPLPKLLVPNMAMYMLKIYYAK